MPEIELVDASHLRRWERILRGSMLIALGSLLAASVVVVVRPTVGNAPAPYAYVAPVPTSLPALPLRLPLIEVDSEVLAGLRIEAAKLRKEARLAQRRDQRDRRAQRKAKVTQDAGGAASVGGASAPVLQVSPGASPSPAGGPSNPAPETAPAPVTEPQSVTTDGHRLKGVVDPVETIVKEAAAVAPAVAPVADLVFRAANDTLAGADAAAPANESKKS